MFNKKDKVSTAASDDEIIIQSLVQAREDVLGNIKQVYLSQVEDLKTEYHLQIDEIISMFDTYAELPPVEMETMSSLEEDICNNMITNNVNDLADDYNLKKEPKLRHINVVKR